MHTAFILKILLSLNSTFAWSDHHLITRAAIEKSPELNSKKVKVTSLEDLFHNFEFHGKKITNIHELNLEIKIRKEYPFEFKIGEKMGKEIPLVDVLSHYSDEPDWGMDKELFGSDQYPELWRPEYSMMGGKEGTPSQSFRHMYWGPFSAAHPLNSFKLPLGKIFDSMGQAPERGQLFYELSQEAKRKGHKYWAWRFLACAYHYFEDVSQPFHAAQTPSKKFLLMPFFDSHGEGLHQFIAQITHIVSYYHFAFEDYLAYIMSKTRTGEKNAEGEMLNGFLNADSDFNGYLQEKQPRMDQLVISLAQMSVAHSDVAAKASIDFFAPIQESFVTLRAGDVVSPQNRVWWEDTISRGMANTPIKKDYFEVVQKMFAPMGKAIRETAKYEAR